ncbi:MAG: ABC transporter permease, partial [Prevotella oris]|nr:ABC transporter permease [Segatella oris]
AMGYSENDYKITASTFLVSNPKDIDKVIENVKKTSVDFSKLSLTKNSKAFDSISTSLKSFGNIIDVMTLGIIIGSIVILSLVLIFWLRERIYEIGILLSIGISKLKIIGQFILEVIMISVGSYIVSILLGKLTSVFIFKGIVSSASEVGTENVFKNVVPRLDIVNMFSTYGILLVIIGLSVIGTSLIILHKKPKEILTNMS